MSVALAVHGGAWDIPPEDRDAAREGCAAAIRRVLPQLEAGGSAIDAVTAAVALLEDDELFDAGRGSVLNADGVIEMDAAVMDGRRLDVGAVAAVSHVRNPIRLARAVLDSDHVFLVGEGAGRYADAHGIARCSHEALLTARERERFAELRGYDRTATLDFYGAPRGTVGAVARDASGHLAAATSTGGSPGKPPGRVGDSGVIAAGTFADDETAAVSVTGWGEALLRMSWALRASELTRASGAAVAAEQALGILERVEAVGGLIMVDRHGEIGVAWSSPALAYAYQVSGGELRAGPAGDEQLGGGRT